MVGSVIIKNNRKNNIFTIYTTTFYYNLIKLAILNQRHSIKSQPTPQPTSKYAQNFKLYKISNTFHQLTTVTFTSSVKYQLTPQFISNCFRSWLLLQNNFTHTLDISTNFFTAFWISSCTTLPYPTHFWFFIFPLIPSQFFSLPCPPLIDFF